MIKLQDLTPAIYYEKSRDFQFIGRLYDIVLNYLKTNADNLYNIPIGTNMNEKLLNLLALTLGFQSKHHYNSTQLAAICSVLPDILRNKGSVNAIIIAARALLQAEHIKQDLTYSIEPAKSITLHLPTQLSDTGLLRDLLTYILPAGISCNMIKEIQKNYDITTEVTTEDVINVYIKYVNSISGLVNLKDSNALIKDGAQGKAGLLPNISIPKDNSYSAPSATEEEENNNGD